MIGHQSVQAQGPCGGKPCPVIKVETPRPRKPPPPVGPTSRGSKQPPSPAPAADPVECQDSNLVVVCGLPGCEITLEGRESTRAKFKALSKVVTDDLGGYTFQVLGNYFYKVRATKPGYDPFESAVKKIPCDEYEEIKATLPAKPVMLRVRTVPPEADIYLEGLKQPHGKSDRTGLFSYWLTTPTLLIEARKPGYLSDTKTVFLAPEVAAQEIVLSLEPIKATLQISANVANARVTIDSQKSPNSITEKILLSPGNHVITVEALGYATARFDISVKPEESLTKTLKLDRLSVNDLQAQAQTLFSRRAYDDVLKLTQFIFEADAINAAANKLAGLVYLERADLPNAELRFDKALAGGETVSLPVRRHVGEKFESNKGHDVCESQLLLTKTELEFRNSRNPAENFKVPYDQVQVLGIQLKNSVAIYLKTKIAIAGKRRDYNFYSFDREISQTGKPYLEMIQRLLRSH